MSELLDDSVRTLGPSNEIADDFVVPYYLKDLKRRISIARVANRLFVFDDLCTCPGEPCPLSGGLLTGATIMCQCHGSRFDVASGAVMNGPATEPLRVYDVEEREGMVQIRV